MRFGVIVFPGSNCDRDCYDVLHNVVRVETEFIWHEKTDLSRFDAIVLPGGFSYGDYLRAGAIARFSPVMQSLPEFIREGRLVIGICNGFQSLLEAGILPGAMLKNASRQFICDWVHLRVENNETPFTRLYRKGEVIRIPIAHSDGNYYTDVRTLAQLQKTNRVIFRYCDERGRLTEEANPNGSIQNIAGIISETGNVLGMMPHPERASEAILGSEDGKRIFLSMVKSVREKLSRVGGFTD